MTEHSSPTSTALLKNYLDRIADAHTCIQDLHVEIGRIRQDSRADGFNMEAVHLLGQILAKSPHDGGTGLMNDIIRYAHRSGVEFDNVVVEQNSTSNTDEIDVPHEFLQTSRFGAAYPSLSRALPLFFQIGFGVALSGAFIWFLH